MKVLLSRMRELEGFREGTRNQTKVNIINQMKETDTCWTEDLNEKTSVMLYKQCRKEIGGQEEVYTNDPASEILFKCKSHTIRLNDENRFKNEKTQCILCGAENENLEHFLLWCPAYSEEGQKNVDLQQPYTNEGIGDLLFNNNGIHG